MQCDETSGASFRQPATAVRPTAIDVFSGAGGLSYGLQAAGFDVKLGVDFDRHALATFAENHSGKALLADVRNISGQDLLDAAGVREVDLLAGGPSCQGFSTHGKRLVDDPRNTLYKEFLRLVEELQPATVLMENVKGLMIAGKGMFKRQVIESFKELGYQVDGRLLLAADYGVPQLRERVFFVASRVGSSIKFPEPTHGPRDSLAVQAGHLAAYRTVADAIGDLPLLGNSSRVEPLPYGSEATNDYQELMRANSKVAWNHVSRPLSALAQSVVSKVRPGQGLRSIPIEELPQRFHKMRRISNGELRRDCTTLYYRLSPVRPSYTITCYFTNVSAGAFTNPWEDRAISPREAARLQSFPDRFRFVGASIPRQIGNAVPPMLAQAMGGMIMEHLREHGRIAA